MLEEGGMDVEYRVSDHGHWIEPADETVANCWVADALLVTQSKPHIGGGEP
jgi:hypothetical protein